MRVSYTYDQLIRCGGLRVAFEHCRELKRRGHDANIYCNFVAPNLHDWIERYQVRPRYLSQYEPQDALISCWWRQMDQVKFLNATKHFHLVQGRDKLSYSPGHSWHEEIDQAMNRLDFQFLAVSAWAGDSCRNPRIVPNGVDTNFWKPAAFLKMAQRFVILLEASTVDAYKGLTESLEVVKQIKEKNPDKQILCWLITQNPINNPIVDREITQANDVQILSCYQNADVLLKATWFDGFGLPHLEAMACGLPLVTTNAGGNMEFCRHDTNCLIAKPQDVAMLTQHVQSLIDSKPLRERLKAGGMMTAKRWTWERSVDRLLEAIGE